MGMTPYDPQQSLDAARWRKAERSRLLALRKSVPLAQRAQMDTKIIERLSTRLNKPERIIGFYWPIQNEPDLRPLIKTLCDRGVVCALPVVVAKDAPLSFRCYSPGDQLEAGVWDIPIPVNGVEVLPDVLLAPVVGFDHKGYRLGYGGGFFDRTMATLKPPPQLIGVGYEIARVPTIFPQAHDKPADIIVTEASVVETDT